MYFYIVQGCCIFTVSMAESLKMGKEHQTLVLPVLRETMGWPVIVFILKKKKGTEHGHAHTAERDISIVQETLRTHRFTVINHILLSYKP